MSFNEEIYEIVHNEPAGQWELRTRNDNLVIGYLSYEIVDAEIYFTRLTVKSEFTGQGLAKALANKALDYEVAKGEYAIVPVCSYVQKVWTERNS